LEDVIISIRCKIDHSKVWWIRVQGERAQQQY